MRLICTRTKCGPTRRSKRARGVAHCKCLAFGAPPNPVRIPTNQGRDTLGLRPTRGSYTSQTRSTTDDRIGRKARRRARANTPENRMRLVIFPTCHLDLFPVLLQLFLVLPPISGEGGLSPVGPHVGQRDPQPPRQGPQELLVPGEAVHRQGELLVVVERPRFALLDPVVVASSSSSSNVVAAWSVRIDPQQSEANLLPFTRTSRDWPGQGEKKAREDVSFMRGRRLLSGRRPARGSAIGVPRTAFAGPDAFPGRLPSGNHTSRAREHSETRRLVPEAKRLEPNAP